MTTNTALHITTQDTIGTATIATLSDGRTIIARNTGDRWTGRLVDVAWFNPATYIIGELITLRSGTSHRLAIDEALTKLNA